MSSNISAWFCAFQTGEKCLPFCRCVTLRQVCNTYSQSASGIAAITSASDLSAAAESAPCNAAKHRRDLARDMQLRKRIQFARAVLLTLDFKFRHGRSLSVISQNRIDLAGGEHPLDRLIVLFVAQIGHLFKRAAAAHNRVAALGLVNRNHILTIQTAIGG